ncbi:MAG: ABC transporter permease [Geminicoccaceae bacterium]
MNAQLGLFRSLVILAAYRGRLFHGVIHEVRKQYSGSVFGMFWAVLFPIMQLGIYAGLYTLIFKVRPSGLTQFDYVLLVFSGLVPLLAFSASLTGAISSLVSNQNLLLNTVFPAELIPVRINLAAQLPMLFGLAITLGISLLTGRAGIEAILLVPAFWILLLMFSLGIGWILSLITLVVRDIQHGIGLVVMLMIFLSPFAYTPEMVPEALKVFLYLNPLSYFVLTFQQLMCYGNLPDLIPALGATGLGLASFFLGFTVFRRAKHVFFDYA